MQIKTLIRRTAAAVVVCLAVVTAGATGASATTASARTVGYVYLSAPTWANNCPGGGSVKYLRGQIWGSVTDYKADYGDDLVYVRVALYQDNTAIITPTCYAWWGTYTGPSSSVTIHPTWSGQTWWIGPSGVWHN